VQLNLLVCLLLDSLGLLLTSLKSMRDAILLAVAEGARAAKMTDMVLVMTGKGGDSSRPETSPTRVPESKEGYEPWLIANHPKRPKQMRVEN
jgi:hypothetical protein